MGCYYKSPEWQAVLQDVEMLRHNAMELVVYDADEDVPSWCYVDPKVNGTSYRIINFAESQTNLDLSCCAQLEIQLLEWTEGHLRRNNYKATPVQELNKTLQICVPVFDRLRVLGTQDQKPGVAPSEVTSRNDDRDRWMYEQKKAGKTHKEIRVSLLNDHPEWEPIENDQSIGRAIDRFTNRNDLPQLRRKQ